MKMKVVSERYWSDLLAVFQQSYQAEKMASGYYPYFNVRKEIPLPME